MWTEQNSSNFFAMLSRMQYINRWSLMRNAHPENLSEHAMEVSMVAHALAVLHNRRFGGSVNPERAALLGLYHDAPECLTGDLPTPVKYYSDTVRAAYQTVETHAAEQLLAMLPEDLRADFLPLLAPQAAEEHLWRFVKAADKISALIKCVKEAHAGNREFAIAAEGLREKIRSMHCQEADMFVAEFLPGYALTLDEIKGT